MRNIPINRVINTVKKLCIESNYFLPNDIYNKLKQANLTSTYALEKETLDVIIKNADIAKEEQVPICQDTGMAHVFVKIGQEVHIEGGLLTDAINEGIRQGYSEGYLRKSIVDDPLYDRINTNDNTPGIIYYDIVEGDKLEIEISPKGFGSENMSKIKMLKPSDGEKGIIDFVLQCVTEAGPNPCPPIVVGVGIGGSFEKVAYIAKKAIMRDINTSHKDSRYSNLEKILFSKINELGIGPAGYGGKNTCLGVNIETYPTHIAGMPVAVCICCHVARHKKVVI